MNRRAKVVTAIVVVVVALTVFFQIAINTTRGGGSGKGTAAPSSPQEPSPTPAPPELAQAIKFREDFGLRADVAYVAQIEADPLANRTLGVALTDDEFRDIDGRNTRVQAIFGSLMAQLSADPTFAGLYINQKEHGRVEMLTTSKDPHRFDRILSSFAWAGVPFLVFGADYTQAELKQVQDRVSSDMPMWMGQGVRPVSVGIDVVANRLTISIENSDQAIAAAMTARYGPAVVVKLGQSPAVAN